MTDELSAKNDIDAPITERAGFVALVGAPNVGKSTLVNTLVGTKVSIVSPKVQTTRRRIIGITIVGQTQIMFVDTPGIFKPRKRLDSAMVNAAWAGAKDADLCLFVIDAKRGLDDRTAHIKSVLSTNQQDCFAVVNKIDLVPKAALLPIGQKINDDADFLATFMISAKESDGTNELLQAIAVQLPRGPWLYPEDQLTDLSNRAMAAEVTREKIFLLLKEELPYAVTVETENWQENTGTGEIRIDQTIYVMRPSQKSIVLGKGGRQIKAIGQASRVELEEIFDARIHLFLFVKVRERWADDPERYREMGLDFPHA